MRATIYDGNGRPAGHIEYQTPFGMFWKAVGYLIIAAMVCFFFVLVPVGLYINERMVNEEEAKHQAFYAEKKSQGLHCYSVTWRYGDRSDVLTDWYLWATSPEEARQTVKEHDDRISRLTYQSDKDAVVVLDVVQYPTAADE